MFNTRTAQTLQTLNCAICEPQGRKHSKSHVIYWNNVRSRVLVKPTIMQVALTAFCCGKTRWRKSFITTKCQIILNRITTCLNYGSWGYQLTITRRDRSRMRRNRVCLFSHKLYGEQAFLLWVVDYKDPACSKICSNNDDDDNNNALAFHTVLPSPWVFCSRMCLIIRSSCQNITESLQSP